MPRVEVVEYDAGWPAAFELIRERVWPAVREVALTIEHVGSTAVPGLAAKPVIDACVVVSSRDEIPLVIERLATVGYRHRGNLGVEDREAFARPPGMSRHHLYASPLGNLSLRNHLGLRDYLRAHPDAANEYGALKFSLAARFPDDIDSYIVGKTSFVLGILRKAGLTDAVSERSNGSTPSSTSSDPNDGGGPQEHRLREEIRPPATFDSSPARGVRSIVLHSKSGDEMATVKRSKEFGVEAYKLWEQIGGWGTIHEWHPAAASTEVSADGKRRTGSGGREAEDGKRRTVTLGNGGVLEEELTDQTDCSYSYRLVSAPLPVKNYQSTIAVRSQGDGSVIDWEGTFEPEGADEATASNVIAGIYEAGLDALP